MIIATLRERGIRVTAQRVAVAEVLASAADHPSAQDVYERVKTRLPHITRATVYNTLRVLSEKGLVQPLHFRHGTRYDGNPHPHANLVCVECGSIVDADINPDDVIANLSKALARTSDFRVMGQRLDLYGLCSRCASSPRRRRKQVTSGMQPAGAARDPHAGRPAVKPR
ncbi:MAG TPA: Fur family transcriptional regulator [Dehalococcoidia bacterium]|nr:Fur family transcriptional regulator [Dehalococcoidia bacterium]